MNKKDTVNVYWAPSIDYSGTSQEWEMLYPDPENLYNSLIKLKNKNVSGRQATFFQCPAARRQFQNTFVFKNVLDAEYKYDFTENKQEILPTSSTYISYNLRKDFGLTVGPSVTFDLSYSFFADQPLEAFFSQPTFSISEYTKYGSLFPGNFDIGRWFRPYNMEVQLWNNKGVIKFKEDDPLFYVYFNTDKKINLQRYKHTPKLQKYIEHCTQAPATMGANLPLISRYKRFTESRFNETILKEIKKNLLGDNND